MTKRVPGLATEWRSTGRPRSGAYRWCAEAHREVAYVCPHARRGWAWRVVASADGTGCSALPSEADGFADDESLAKKMADQRLGERGWTLA